MLNKLNEMELTLWALDSYIDNLPKDKADVADKVRHDLERAMYDKRKAIVETWEKIYDLCRDLLYNVNDLASVKADFSLDEGDVVQDVVGFVTARLEEYCAEFEPIDFDF